MYGLGWYALKEKGVGLSDTFVCTCHTYQRHVPGVKVKLALEQAMKAQRGVALLFLYPRR